jgi:alpha-acetolactate decarboxylase
MSLSVFISFTTTDIANENPQANHTGIYMDGGAFTLGEDDEAFTLREDDELEYVMVQFFVRAESPCILSWVQSSNPLSGLVVRTF